MSSHPLVNRRQNVAIGLTGLPDVPAKRTGATARWKNVLGGVSADQRDVAFM
jgi:hypothetical protein